MMMVTVDLQVHKPSDVKMSTVNLNHPVGSVFDLQELLFCIFATYKHTSHSTHSVGKCDKKVKSKKMRREHEGEKGSEWGACNTMAAMNMVRSSFVADISGH
jgi:hypothetical protein